MEKSQELYVVPNIWEEPADTLTAQACVVA